jgi:phosphoenolpyruvate synthase/pyruvate phosphate dikinase
MSLILPFEQITEKDRPRVGGKAYALSVLARTGVRVPSGVCIIADAYRHRRAHPTGAQPQTFR